MENLKNCPFCGNESHVYYSKSPWLDYHPIGEKRHYPRCQTEKCPGNNGWVGFATKAEAIAAWNTRKSPWIKIKEPPKKKGHYFILLNTGSSDRAYYNPKNNRWNYNEKYITHWMPIPALPTDDLEKEK